MSTCLDTDQLADLAMAHALGEPESAQDHAHIDGCTTCAAVYSDAAKTARDLVRLARRAETSTESPCLSANDLAELSDAAVAEQDLPRITAHLAHCQACIAALTELTRAARAADTAESPARYAIRLAKRTVEFLTKPDLGFAPSHTAIAQTLATKEEDTLYAWTQRVDGAPVHVRLQQALEADPHLTLSLEAGDFAPNHATIVLRKDGDLVQSEALGDDGHIRVPNLQRGNYTFEIETHPGTTLRLDFDLS